MFSQAEIQSLHETLRGPLLFPDDADYDEVRRIHNAMIDRRPCLIARCAGVADVIALVRFARERNLPVSVRGTGHNVAGTCVCDGGMMIDLSQMKGIHVDPAARTARVEAGVTWAEFNHELHPFGLAATGGFVGTTGVAGLTLGGGLGWMVRKHGLALDNLLSADVVTADAQFLVANPTENRDLFWGIRGGGGNFGIVTSFEFKVHPVGTVFAGLVLHPLSQGRDALRHMREFEDTSPQDFTNSAVIFNPPAGLPVPEILHREGIVGLGGVYVGALEDAERILHPLRSFGPPVADTFQPMPYRAAQTMADFLWPRGSYNYWKSSYLKALTDDAIETILKFVSIAPSKRTVVVIEHNGDGAIEHVRDDETAFPHRHLPWDILVTAVWTNASESDANIRWTIEFWEAMRPYLSDAVYVNYLGEEGQDRVRAAYGTKYERLVALKDKYDPTNFFRMNQNIKPSGAEVKALA